jgi:hypothetical protein
MLFAIRLVEGLVLMVQTVQTLVPTVTTPSPAYINLTPSLFLHLSSLLVSYHHLLRTSFSITKHSPILSTTINRYYNK